METLTESAANAVWDLLVAEGGASPTEDARQQFVYHQTTAPCREYRFGGLFGFGGKFYKEWKAWRVDCYREDETEERKKARESINTKLVELYQRHSNAHD